MLSGVEYNRRESVDQIESAESEVGPRDYASRITFKASSFKNVHMTTTIYRIAYPHPSLQFPLRTTVCDVDQKTFKKNPLSQLYEEFPDHSEDLKRATLWKVPPFLSIARYSALTGITGWRYHTRRCVQRLHAERL